MWVCCFASCWQWRCHCDTQWQTLPHCSKSIHCLQQMQTPWWQTSRREVCLNSTGMLFFTGSQPPKPPEWFYPSILEVFVASMFQHHSLTQFHQRVIRTIFVHCKCGLILSLGSCKYVLCDTQRQTPLCCLNSVRCLQQMQTPWWHKSGREVYVNSTLILFFPAPQTLLMNLFFFLWKLKRPLLSQRFSITLSHKLTQGSLDRFSFTLMCDWFK